MSVNCGTILYTIFTAKNETVIYRLGRRVEFSHALNSYNCFTDLPHRGG
jgi:hypothetical protein